MRLFKPCVKRMPIERRCPGVRPVSMQWPAIVSCYHYLQTTSHKLVVSLATDLCGLGYMLIEDCRWAIEDWLLLTLLAIEGMLLSWLVVRLVKRRV